MAVLAFLFASTPDVYAHGVTEGDKGYIQESSGTMIVPFIYLGAKHMVT
ncbi:MAG: HupE/UreJ family protein, partial [Candidatus Scalindua sp.]|nr:HupE/UreJ family protein [Candidatus Scalindua sp.]